MAPSVVLLLWFTGKRDHARHVLLGTILCFYSGYVLYVLFPAAPPRLYLESLGMFSVTLRGGPIADFQQALIEMMPNQAARAAFPSLHSAVSCLSLVYAWRYCRWFFPILLVFVVRCSSRRCTCATTGSSTSSPAPPSCRGCCGSRPRFERWWRARVQRRRAAAPSPSRAVRRVPWAGQRLRPAAC